MQGTIHYENVAAVARRLNVHPETVRRWVRADEIPYVRIGGVVRFDPAEVDRWIATHRNVEVSS